MKLCDRDIEEYLAKGMIKIDPQPEADCIKGISVDLRLGNSFRVFEDHTAPYIDLSGPKEEVAKQIDKIMGKEIVIPDDGEFFLHPGELALAVTHESVSIPDNLVGWLDGRSSLARLGLMVHVTAHRIDPGWHGQIVLECFNSGKLPLSLKPMMNICAINFEVLTGHALRPYNKRVDAKYKNQRGAVASLIGKDSKV